MKVLIPPSYAIDHLENRKSIQQLAVPGRGFDATISELPGKRVRGYRIDPASGEPAIGLVTNNGRAPGEFETVLRSKGTVIAVDSDETCDLGEAQWLKPSGDTPASVADFEGRVGEVIDSWHNAFKYKEEHPELSIKGLRPPQLASVACSGRKHQRSVDVTVDVAEAR
jgi:hypothetical protein